MKIYVTPFLRPLHSDLYRLFDNKQVDGQAEMVGISNVIALSYIQKIFSDTELETNPELDVGKWDSDFVTIGAVNPRTAEVLHDKFSGESFFGFSDDFSSIVQVPTEIQYGSAVDGFGNSVPLEYQKKVVIEDGKDYGILLRLFDADHIYFVIAGIGGNGTAGAAYFLRNFSDLMNSSEPFGVLVEVNIEQGHESAKQVEFDEVSILRATQYV